MWRLGDYARGYRILRGFLPSSGDLMEFGAGLKAEWQSIGLNELGLMARRLGRLRECADIRRADDTRSRIVDDAGETCRGLSNTYNVAVDLGRLREALATAQDAVEQAERAGIVTLRVGSLSSRASAQHQLGEIAAARNDFAAATKLENAPLLYSNRGQRQAGHYLDLGKLAECREITQAGLRIAIDQHINFELPGWHALLARITFAEGQNPSSYIDEIRVWTARTGDMPWILEAHELAARAALIRGDLSAARAEADDGLRQARLCGYRLRQIELLVTLSAIDLAWPDAKGALASAREALDLAMAPECQYAWGEADAAHAWGLAFEALGEREHAQRAFGQALAVRERIEHPKAADTRAALARVS